MGVIGPVNWSEFRRLSWGRLSKDLFGMGVETEDHQKDLHVGPVHFGKDLFEGSGCVEYRVQGRSPTGQQQVWIVGWESLTKIFLALHLIVKETGFVKTIRGKRSFYT